MGFACFICFLLSAVCEERVPDACMYVCAHMELSRAQQSGQQGEVLALQSSHNKAVLWPALGTSNASPHQCKLNKALQ